MILHCAGRLGVLNYLYTQRHTIGLALGLIEEIPITECSSNYDFSDELRIESNQTEHSIPQSLLQPRDISLFYISDVLSIKTFPDSASSEQEIVYKNAYQFCFTDSVFRPPIG